MEKDNQQGNKTNRKDFLKKSLLTGSVPAAGAIGINNLTHISVTAIPASGLPFKYL